MHCLKNVAWSMVLGLALLQPALAGKQLRIATTDDYPPFSDLNDKGELSGFDVEIAQALCQAMNMNCLLLVAPWDDIIPGLIAGKYDAIVGSMGKTPEREKVIDFTDHYYRANSLFVGKTGCFESVSPEALKGKMLTCPRNTLQSDYLTEHYASTAHIILTDTTEAAFTLLVKGQADLALESELAIYEFLKTDNGKEFDFVGEPIKGALSSPAYIGVRKADLALKQAFNKAIQQIRQDGVYSKINRKYFPFDVY